MQAQAQVQAQPCIVLTPELARNLQSVNAFNRTLREVGIVPAGASALDATIFIQPSDVERLSTAFKGEFRGVMWSTKGAFTRHQVRLRGVLVCWLVPVKEQV